MATKKGCAKRNRLPPQSRGGKCGRKKKKK